jgi:hypothetical protein
MRRNARLLLVQKPEIFRVSGRVEVVNTFSFLFPSIIGLTSFRSTSRFLTVDEVVPEDLLAEPPSSKRLVDNGSLHSISRHFTTGVLG